MLYLDFPRPPPLGRPGVATENPSTVGTQAIQGKVDTTIVYRCSRGIEVRLFLELRSLFMARILGLEQL